jgi:hypothetical protein
MSWEKLISGAELFTQCNPEIGEKEAGEKSLLYSQLRSSVPVQAFQNLEKNPTKGWATLGEGLAL